MINNDKTLRIILLGLLIFMVGLTGSFVAGYWMGQTVERADIMQHADTTYVTMYDTIPCYYPVAKDSSVIRYITRTLAAKPQGTVAEPLNALPAAKPQGTVAAQGAVDSVSVTIPITQKVYEADSYRAYVSGYEPSLDSIFVREKTVRETVTVPVKQKQSRFGFGVGVGAGYGIINKKPDIFIGGTVYMRIF
jgi:hypothetical protein